MKRKLWNQRIKEILKWLLSCAAFGTIVLFCLIHLGKVMQDKTGKENVTALYLPDAKYDVVLLGTSHVISSMFPMIMWEEAGVTACNYAQNGQPFPLTYYAAEEAIRIASPKLLVCDLYYVYMNGKYTGNTSYKHQTLDNMSMKSVSRLRAIADTIPNEEKLNFLLPFFAYHSRWSDLKKKDFIPAESYSKGSNEVFSHAETPFKNAFVPVDKSEKKKPNDTIIGYIDRMIKLCKDTDTQLLFTVVPYYAMGEQQGRQLEDDQRRFNWIADYVAKQGVECLNMLYHIDEMGFDMNGHMREWNHQNYWGGQVTSSYLANYIHEHYGIKDHRGEREYEQWNEDMKQYDIWREKKLSEANPA